MSSPVARAYVAQNAFMFCVLVHFCGCVCVCVCRWANVYGGLASQGLPVIVRNISGIPVTLGPPALPRSREAERGDKLTGRSPSCLCSLPLQRRGRGRQVARPLVLTHCDHLPPHSVCVCAGAPVCSRMKTSRWKRTT